MGPSATILQARLTAKAKIRHLQVMVKLAELQTMRRTAESLGITQPAVTQLVAELEALIEAPLFLRHARGVHLTPIVRDLLPIATRILDAVGEGAEVIAANLEEFGGVVRVAATPAAIGGMLHPVVPRFARRYPRLHLSIFDVNGANPFAPVATNACDLLCLRQPEVIPKGWTFRPCVTDELVVVCGSAHPLAAQARAGTDDLGRYRWLLNRVGSVARKRYEDFATAHGWPETLGCSYVMHIPSLTFEMLASDEYLAIIPRSAAQPWLRTGQAVALDTPMTLVLGPLGYLMPEDRTSPAIRAFAAELGRP